MKILRVAVLFLACLTHSVAYSIYFNSLNIRPFDGTNGIGEVDIYEFIDYINVDDEIQIDVSIIFNSNRRIPSRMFGYGWWFGLTDSYISKVSHDSYKFVKPNRDELILRQDLKNKERFNSEISGHKLEKEGNGYLIYGCCGESFYYEKNILTQTRYENGTVLSFKYEKGKLKEVISNNKPVLSFRYENDDVIYMDLIEKKRTIRFKLMEVPGYGKLLSEYADFPEAKRLKKFSYKFYDNNISEITITQNNAARKFFWESDTGFIVKEESYRNSKLVDAYEYQIANRDDPDIYKYIKRKSKFTNKDDVIYKNDNGISITQKDSGDIVKIYDSMERKTFGKPQKIEIKHPDGSEDIQEFIYDKKGRIVSEIKNGEVLYNVKRDDDERSITYCDGKWNLIWKKIFDSQNRIISYEKSDGTKTTFKYLEDGKIEATLTKNGKTITKVFNENLNIINERQ